MKLNAAGNANPLAESNSGLSFNDEEKEPIKMRLAVRPLIAGLHQANSTTAPLQTYINRGGIMSNGRNVGKDGSSIKYKVGSVGEFNNQFGLDNSTSGIDKKSGVESSSGRRRLPRYLITKVDINGLPEKLVLIDSGEYINPNGRLVLNDPNTFESYHLSSLTESQFIDENCSFIIPQAADIGVATESFTSRRQILPFQLGMVNNLIASAVLDNAPSDTTNSASFAKDLTINVIGQDSNTGNSGISFAIRQWQPNSVDYASEEYILEEFRNNPATITGQTNVAIFGNPATWNSEVTFNPSRTHLTNWTNFNATQANCRVKLEVKIKNIFEAEVAVSYSTDGGQHFQERCILLKTFESATILNSQYPKMECTMKSRLYPYYPCISMYPAPLNTDEHLVQIQGRLLKYPQRFNQFGQRISHYEKNLFNMVPFAVPPSIFDFPNSQTDIGGANLVRPPIMMKFGPNITTTNTPSFNAINELPPTDIVPAAFSNFSEVGGFMESIFAVSNDYTGTPPQLVISAPSDADNSAFVDTFLVECPSLTAKGFNMYNFNTAGKRIGTGVMSPVIGVVPFVEQNRAITTSTDSTTLRYSTPYQQPVLVKLPVETNIYNLEFRLRDIQTGNYITGLQNPTQLILRIKELP